MTPGDVILRLTLSKLLYHHLETSILTIYPAFSAARPLYTESELQTTSQPITELELYILSLIPKRARSILLIVILVWILYICFDCLPGFKPVRKYSRFRHDLRLLNNTVKEQFDPLSRRPFPVGGSWLDLAGFRKGDGMAWERLTMWWRRCQGVGEWRRRSWHNDTPHISVFEEEYWDKATAEWSGEWVRYTGDLSPAEQTRAKNRITDVAGNEGRVTVNFQDMAGLEMEVFAHHDVEYELGYVSECHLERGARLVREAAATLTIQDESMGNEGFHVDVYGVHWPRVGVLLMTTTSVNFAGIIGLPHLSLNWDHFTSSQRLLSYTVGKTSEGKKAISFEEGTPRTAILGTNPKLPSCQYTVYIQMNPIEKQNMWINISEVESVPSCEDPYTSLGNTESPISMAIFSPDCGFILETKGQRLDFSIADKMYIECKEQDEA